MKDTITSNEATMVEFSIDNKDLAGSFYILPHNWSQLTIGVDFMQTWSITVDPKNESRHVGTEPKNIELYSLNYGRRRLQ